MTKTVVFLLFSILFMGSLSFAKTKENPCFAGVLKSRKVVGVIYFNNYSDKLSKNQEADINRIASLVISQSSSDKIVRVEGFMPTGGIRANSLSDSLSRAKTVWYFLSKIEFFNSGNLYLTGFGASQSFSELQGERVEIAIYDNPFNENFNEKVGIYSSN